MPLRCESCGGIFHRACLGLVAAAYAGGWFSCVPCILATAGLDPERAGTAAVQLAWELVAPAASAVADSSSLTYMSHRRRYVRFCEEQLGLAENDALPWGRDRDINPVTLGLFIASTHYARSTFGFV